jgi:tRNA A-37 threonylcarbamoyl transferase component Bud32
VEACGEADREVIGYQAGRLRWLVRRATGREITEILDGPDRFLVEPARLLAHSDLITLGMIPPLTADTPPLLLRRLNYRRLRHRLRDCFRPTRAERAFRHGLGLEQAGVRTPRVLAAGVERRLRWPVRAYLLTEFVPDAVTLDQYLTAQRRLPRELVVRLADLLARLHAQGFSHRDLKASNVLFDRALQPYLIDLDGVRHHGSPNDKETLANLARLAREFVVYPSELGWNAARFLQRYCQQRQRPDSFQPWAKELARRLPRSGGSSRPLMSDHP